MKAIKIIGILISLFLFFAVLPWAILLFGLLFTPNPPAPAITYGEFPCRLEYELDGETKVIEDVIICEFDGFKQHGEAGKYRNWKISLQSGNENMTLLDLRPLNETTEVGNQLLELNFFYGNGEYYMDDDYEWHARPAQDFDTVCVIYETPDGIIGGSGYTAEEAWEKYKIRLISWECESPIENQFPGD